jgi:hypothetical protein
MPERLRVGGIRLRLPANCTTRLLGRADDHAAVRDFVLESPDHTVYHFEPYFEYARRDPEGGPGDVALVLESGNPLFAIPLHVRPQRRIVTGYSGILFPPTNKETVLRRSIRALAAFLAANGGLTFEVIQSAQAAGYDDPRRMALIKRFLAELDVETRPIFTRVLSLSEPATMERTSGSFPGSVTIAPACLDNSLLRSYDADARNQVRQALRNGLTVNVFSGEATASAYPLIQPLHEATWARSGWIPHPIDYWLALTAAINRPEGASDLVVAVGDADGRLLAGVVCHRYSGRALYWSGCSTNAAGPTHANPLCLHAAITACSATGVELFEIGRFDARERSEKERAVTRYKSQFRGELLEVINFSRLTIRAKMSIIGRRIGHHTAAIARRTRR